MAVNPTADRIRFPVDPWALVETRHSDADLGECETLFAVGNGYLGMRANPEEGRESFTHGTFINGFHETWSIRHAEEAYGFARVGQTIVNVPDAKIIRLYIDDEPLLLSVADIEHYRRRLGFDDGILSRDVMWTTPSGRRVLVRSTRMVSFTERHLAAMTFEVTLMDSDAPVVLSSQILNRQDGQDEYNVPKAAMGAGFDPRKAGEFQGRVLQPVSHWCGDERVLLTYRCTHSGMTLAVGSDHLMETANSYTMRELAEPDLAKVVYRVDAKAGVPIKLTKFVAYHTSRGVPPRELVDRCRRTLDRAGDKGIARLRTEQHEWLDSYWQRSDVQLGAESELQQAVRWNLFQLAQAAARAESSGIPAKGVTGTGYGGHYFWDTEIYVLPFLTYTSPRLARNALRFRYSMLPAARERAAELSERGALFPWRTINGEEASAYYAAGTAQYHIDADIAYAMAQYFTATGDVAFMAAEGIDVLVETARMWADLGFWRTDGDQAAFHIHGVTGPDEYTTVVNDNLFTNVMARYNLRIAARAVRSLAEYDEGAYQAMESRLNLGEAEVVEWERAAEAMSIPFAEHLGIHPQDAEFLQREVWDLAQTPPDRRPLLLHYHPLVIYRFQVLKQADVVLALFLHAHDFTALQKLADFEYYDPITTGDSTLSGVVQSIIAAEVGYQDLAMDYFRDALMCDLSNLHGNTADGVHVANAGGLWSVLVCGFGGMRDAGGTLMFDPRLPVGWDFLSFRLAWLGATISVTVRPEVLELSISPGGEAHIDVRGTTVHLSDAEPVATIPLEDQGPLREGRPRAGAFFGNRRMDGTLITASVPTGSDTKQETDGTSLLS